MYSSVSVRSTDRNSLYSVRRQIDRSKEIDRVRERKRRGRVRVRTGTEGSKGCGLSVQTEGGKGRRKYAYPYRRKGEFMFTGNTSENG